MKYQPSLAEKHVVLCLNSGSSSLKFALYSVGEEESQLARGAAERIGLPGGRLWVHGSDSEKLLDVDQDFTGHIAAASAIATAANTLGLPFPSAVGHRVVHGGPHHSRPERLNDSLLDELRSLIPFAPLHLPSAIQCIEAVIKRFPNLPQVVCFDTAFHRSMPRVAQRLPLPRELWYEGVRRYGFHGLSYEYIVSALGRNLDGNAVIAHLGNGCSLAALRNGGPIDTTMGFTPNGGVMMGTRSGDLDPGVLIHLMTEKSYKATEIDDIVSRHSGLLGVSAISSDMKTLLEQHDQEPHAAEAVELFCYHIRKQIGALTAALGGLHNLVFTGGIGERAAPIRSEVCRGLGHLGIAIDERKNAIHEPIVSTEGSSCTVRVIRTNEDLMIARHTYSLLFSMATVPR
jgi:acetate kinase